MKKTIKFSLILSLVAILTSCYENPSLIYNGATVVEFDAAVTTAPAAGKTYPLIAVSNGAGVLKTRINLVGAQKSTETVIKVSVLTDATTATNGTNFKLLTPTVTIPANSSFGEAQIEILTVPAAAGQTRSVVLTLDGDGGNITGSTNFKTLGWTIRL